MSTRKLSISEEYGELGGGFLRFWEVVDGVERGEVSAVVDEVDVVESEEGMGEDEEE